MNEIAKYLVERIENPISWVGLLAIVIIVLLYKVFPIVKSWKEFKDGYHELELEKKRLELIKLKLEIDNLRGKEGGQYIEIIEQYRKKKEHVVERSIANKYVSNILWAVFKPIEFISKAIFIICMFFAVPIPMSFMMSGDLTFGQASLTIVAFWLIAFVFGGVTSAIESFEQRLSKPA